MLESVFSLQRQTEGAGYYLSLLGQGSAKGTWDTNTLQVCSSPTALLKAETTDVASQPQKPTSLCEKQCFLHPLQFL